MTNDKNTCLKVIEAILFANSDLVDEKYLTKFIPIKPVPPNIKICCLLFLKRIKNISKGSPNC